MEEQRAPEQRRADFWAYCQVLPRREVDGQEVRLRSAAPARAGPRTLPRHGPAARRGHCQP